MTAEKLIISKLADKKKKKKKMTAFLQVKFLILEQFLVFGFS